MLPVKHKNYNEEAVLLLLFLGPPNPLWQFIVHSRTTGTGAVVSQSVDHRWASTGSLFETQTVDPIQQNTTKVLLCLFLSSSYMKSICNITQVVTFFKRLKVRSVKFLLGNSSPDVSHVRTSCDHSTGCLSFWTALRMFGWQTVWHCLWSWGQVAYSSGFQPRTLFIFTVGE